MIKRDVYLNRLISGIGNDSVKVVTGLRRVGKSYLLNKIFYEYLLDNDVKKERIIKFAFDSAEDLNTIGEDLVELEKAKRPVDYKKFMKFVSGKISKRGRYFLLLDEVQRMDSFEFVLNGYLAKGNLEIYVTGSNSKFLSSDVITEFRGRGDEIHVLPLSYSEISQLKSYKNNGLEKYMVFGGLPRVALADSDERRINYLKEQMERTYLKDVIERNKVRNKTELGELLNILASGIASLTNPRKLANTFSSVKNINMAESTISKYLGYLKEAFIINSAERFDVKGKKYISTPYKIFFEDIGLRNVRLNFRQVEYTHIMENIIFNELRYRGYAVDVGSLETVDQNKRKQLEIDFVVNKGSSRYYIQSAYDIPDAQKLQQETRAFDQIKDSFKKIIIVNRNLIPHMTDKGYLLISLENFLLDKDCLEKNY
ncbi:ATP-binding protein [bacterium]|nr:ATP-binding protein [bacterium]